MAFAIIQTGGKQYRVSPGSTLSVEKLELEEGAAIRFEQVLLVQDVGEPLVGAPFLQGVVVTGEVVSQYRGEKIRVSTYKPKKRQSRTLGHRQSLTLVKIGEFVLPKATKTAA